MKAKNCDLLYRLIVVLAIQYLLFFFIEAVVPGLIVGVFNLNILLGLVVVGILLMLIKRKDCLSIWKTDGEIKSGFEGQWSWGFFLLLLVTSLVMVIVLHKVPLILILIYLVVTGMVIFALWRLVVGSP
jgi:hypothetical protein